MSGKRQHFIPRFLQEGFASHTTGEKVFTWVYRKAAIPFNSNIINVGVEGQFYTTDDDSTADEVITAAEGSFGALIGNLRSDIRGSLRDPQLPHLVVHLETRSRHLRESFLRTGEWLVARFLDFLADGDAFAGYLTRKLENDPAMFRQAFAEEFAKHGVPEALLEPLMRITSPLLPAFIQRQKSEFSKLAGALRSGMPGVLRAAAKSGHIRALKDSAVPQPRLQRYEGLTYTVAKVLDGPLILGDSMVLFDVNDSTRYRAFLDSDDTLNAVFLPLDRERVLIGSRNSFDGDLSGLRDGIARCSLEYFIAAEKSDTNDRLQIQIGADAHLVTQDELEDILTEVIQG